MAQISQCLQAIHDELESLRRSMHDGFDTLQQAIRDELGAFERSISDHLQTAHDDLYALIAQEGAQLQARRRGPSRP